MKKVNELYSLETVSDIYYVTKDLKVINITNGREKTVSIGKRGYPYVTLETKDDKANKKVFLHKIIALAFIENRPYELIEHLDDNPLNYSIENLAFSTHSKNAKRAFKNGKIDRQKKEKYYKVTVNNEVFYGTVKELSKKTGIHKNDLYRNAKTNHIKSFTIKQISRPSTIENI